MRLLAILLLVASAWFVAAPAAAQTCSATMPALWFGNLTTPLPQSDVAPALTISCSNGAANDTVRICVGIQPPGSPRQLLGPGGAIGYQLYADAALPDGAKEALGEEVRVDVDALGGCHGGIIL